MMRKLLALSLLMSVSTAAHAKLDYDKKAGPIHLEKGLLGQPLDLGIHYRVFIVEKNVKRENQVVIFSELDDNCAFQRDRHEDRISFDFYWWMDNRKSFKNPAPALRPYMKDEFDVVGTGANGVYAIHSKNINKLDRNDTGGAPNFTLKAEKKGGNCEVNAYITIKGKTFRVNSMYVHGEKAGLFNQDPAVCKIILNQGEPTEVLLNGDKAQSEYQNACKTSENAR